MQRIAVTARVAGGAAAAVRPAGAAVAAAARVGVRPQGVGRNYAARAAPGRGRTALAASAAAWRQLPPSAPTSRALSAGAAEEAKQPIEVTIEKVAKPDPQKVCSALLLRVDEREGGRVCVCVCVRVRCPDAHRVPAARVLRSCSTGAVSLLPCTLRAGSAVPYVCTRGDGPPGVAGRRSRAVPSRRSAHAAARMRARAAVAFFNPPPLPALRVSPTPVAALQRHDAQGDRQLLEQPHSRAG
jgi:hypothetical protein